jgi:FkbM family methyltransferase
VYRLDHLNFHLHRLGVDLVVDVGADIGHFAKDLRSHGYRGTIISFELLAQAHAALETAARGDPLWKVASRCSVGVVANSFGSSLLPTHDGRVDADLASRSLAKEDVERVRLDDYLTRLYPDGIPSFALKINMRGFEAEVLDGLGGALGRCSAVLLEMPLAGANLPSLYQRLEQAGLRCAGMSPGERHPISRDAVEIDGLFVRDGCSSRPLADLAFWLFTSVPPHMSRNGPGGSTDVGTEYQRECVRSWVRAGFKIVSLNSASERDAVAALDLPLEIVVTDQDRRPTISDFVTEMRRRGSELCGIINADCRMLDYPETALALRAGASDGVVIADRIDTVLGETPVRYVPGGFDMFLFPVRQLEKLENPPFSIGETWWDFWLPVAFAATGLKVRKLATPLLVHHDHVRAWSVDQWRDNAHVFWRDMRRWRVEKPEVFSGLDDEIGDLWDRDLVTRDEIDLMASRVHRWLDEQLWDPATGMVATGIVPTLIRAFRRETGEVWRQSQEVRRQSEEVWRQGEEVRRLRAEVTRREVELAKRIEDLDAYCQQLEDALNEIKSSFAWPLTKPIRLLERARRRRRDRLAREDSVLRPGIDAQVPSSKGAKIDKAPKRWMTPLRGPQRRDDEFLFWIDFVYSHCLGRAPDAVGTAGWLAALNRGISFSRLVKEIEASEEGRTEAFGHLSDGEFIINIAELLPEGGASPKDIETGKRQLKESRLNRIAFIRHLLNTRLERRRCEEAPGTPNECRIMGTEICLRPWMWDAKVTELQLQPTRRDRTPSRPALSQRQFEHSGRYVVSAIASLYKGRRYLEGFLENITSQTIFDHSELIIIDADSPEREAEVIAEYQKVYPNIVYKRVNYRIGVYDAWNEGVKLARGRYLTSTNLDDLRSGNSFELQAAALDRHRFADIVYQDFLYTFDPGFTFEQIAAIGFKSRLPLVTPNNLLVFNSPHNAPMWRKALHGEVGLFDTSFKSAGDYEFWLRCLSNGKRFFKINVPHIAYYHNPEGVSTRADSVGVEEGRRLLVSYSRKLVSKYLTMSRQEFADSLGIAADWNCDMSYYDVAQSQLRRLAEQYKSESSYQRRDPSQEHERRGALSG